MKKSIFDVEIRLDFKKEFFKMLKYLHYAENTTKCNRNYYTFIGAIDSYIYKYWPYRGTTLNCTEFLESIGISKFFFAKPDCIDIDRFLYYIEFIYNIYEYAMYSGSICVDDENVKAVLENIEIIAEKLNYKFVQQGDKFLLTKRDVNVDSVINKVDEDIALLLLEYNDFKVKDNLKRKNEILKSIDKYIEKNQSEYSNIDKDSYKSFGYILNNFGVNHKINDKYKDITTDKLLKWYDKAFDLAIHLIRFADVKKINKERKELEK
ncbi:MAG: hypothetical protein IJ715_02320 [Bacilli bacterium]|nr:hypothetical protein [Bacilli bacterium]